MARAAACYTDNDVESSIEDCDTHSVKLHNVVANKKDGTLNEDINNPCSVLVENEVFHNTQSLESWQEITDSGHFGTVYTFTHKKSNVNESKNQVPTENGSSVPIPIQNVNQKQFAEHALKEMARGKYSLGMGNILDDGKNKEFVACRNGDVESGFSDNNDQNIYNIDLHKGVKLTMEEESSNSCSSSSEETKTFTILGFDESMSEPPTPLPTRRHRSDLELGRSVSTMSEISTSSSKLQSQCGRGSNVHINYNMHIAKADLRTVNTEKAEITNVNIENAENVNSSKHCNKTNSRNTDAGFKIIDDAEWHISMHEEKGIRLNNTQVFHEAVKKLGWNKVIVIVGNNGCGKRSLAMELLRHFSNDHKEFCCTPVIIKDSCDWNTHVNPKCEYIILLDSLCGSAGIFNREHFLKWDPYFKDILKYIKNSKNLNDPFLVIITIRDNIWKENKIFFREYDLFKELEKYVFDMTNEYGFSNKEKYMMLSNYLTKSYKQKLTSVQICSDYRQEYLEESNPHDLKISERTLKHISGINTPVGFLRCMDEFVKNVTCTRKGAVFFERPLNLLVNELKFLFNFEGNKENLYHYFLLILIVWHDGSFDLNKPLQCEKDILSLIDEDNETKILNFLTILP